MSMTTPLARALPPASVLMLMTALTGPALAQTTLTQIAELQIPEANQGVGVDEHHFYAVDDRTIAKYTKQGQLVAKWEGPADGPIIHLDSATVIDGKIYASHSNYRFFPMTSSVEVWDAKTMKHIGSHSIGIRLGSLTWLDKHDGHWWGTFANYDRTGRNPDGTNSTLPYGGKHQHHAGEVRQELAGAAGLDLPGRPARQVRRDEQLGRFVGPGRQPVPDRPRSGRGLQDPLPHRRLDPGGRGDHPRQHPRPGHRLGSLQPGRALRHHPRHQRGSRPRAAPTGWSCSSPT